MKSFPLSAHLGYLFSEMPLEDRFAAAARCGFRYVEHPAPYSMPAALFADLCREYRLTPAQIALPVKTTAEKGLASLVGRELEFGHALEEAIAYARRIGCKLIHPMAGVPAPDSNLKDCERTYLSNLRRCCTLAAAAGLDVIIEPISQSAVKGYFLNHPDQARSAMIKLGASNLRLCVDTFHFCDTGTDLVDFVYAHGDSIAHVQVADAPGRNEPGSGTIDFGRFFAALAAVGYSGVIGLEYHPRRSTIAGLTWVQDFPQLGPMLRGNTLKHRLRIEKLEHEGGLL